jgi:hypothetical protein
MHIHIYKAIYETKQPMKKAECLKIFVYIGAGTTSRCIDANSDINM